MELITYIEWLGTALGLLYVYLEIKHKNSMWLVGIAMSLCYIAVFAEQLLFASMVLYGCYVVISVVGWWRWRRAVTTSHPMAIHSITRREMGMYGTLLVLLSFLSYVVLARYTEDPAPFLDALITALNITATLMLTRSITEQWLLLLVANCLAVGMYLSLHMIPTTLLFGVYVISSVWGYVKWAKQKKG